jgi:MFS family permease
MFKIFKHLLPLFVVQFFTWLGLFSLWIYATPVITKYVFKTTDSESTAFENGTAWVGICFAFYSLLAATLAFYLPLLQKKVTIQKLHALSLFAGSFGLMLMYFITDKYLLLISFTFIGIAWSSISTVPYTLVSSIAPDDKMTRYFAVFNFSVVIPQVTAAFLLGYLNKHFFMGETVLVIFSGGISLLLAGIIMLVIPVLKKSV